MRAPVIVALAAAVIVVLAAVLLLQRRHQGPRDQAALERAVGEAEFAVLAAQAAGAPAGELDVLCRRLREARPAAARSVSGADDLLAAARMIQGAAGAVIAALPQAADVTGPAGDAAALIARAAGI